MSHEIVMPNLGFDSQESRLIEWLKQPGEAVQRGEAIAVIESDKAEVELESSADGILLDQLYPADTVVPVGATIAHVGDAHSTVPAKASDLVSTTSTDVTASPIAKRIASEHGVALAEVAGSGPRGRVTRQDVEAHIQGHQNGGIKALPKVRKSARESGIDLREITPSDPRGIITLSDLQAYMRQESDIESATPAKPIAQPSGKDTSDRHQVPISRVRAITGQRMSASKREAPHFYVSGEFDLEAALQRLGERSKGPKINDLVQYIAVRALLQTPELNATYQDGNLYHYSGVHLAIAVALPDGLLAPVLHHAERYSLEGLTAQSRDLVKRARSNQLQPGEMSGGTFTVSNLGVIKQVDEFIAVINPPQVAILAVGAVKQRPMVIDGGLHVRHTVCLTLSGDHRAVDGMNLARYLEAFDQELKHFGGS